MTPREHEPAGLLAYVALKLLDQLLHLEDGLKHNVVGVKQEIGGIIVGIAYSLVLLHPLPS